MNDKRFKPNLSPEPEFRERDDRLIIVCINFFYYLMFFVVVDCRNIKQIKKSFQAV